MPEKKRHHYVPVTYLSRFADLNGRVFAYRKDEPTKPLHVRPSEIGFEKYYYSQPLPEGGRDNDRLEDLFSTLESRWPYLVDSLTAKADISEEIEALFQFIALMRVRGPAARDSIEIRLANDVLRVAQELHRSGEVEVPAELGPNLEGVEVSIDPHQSIHAMPAMMTEFGEIFGYAVHNRTALNFITSDNPVIYFDPDAPEHSMKPFALAPGGRVELLFPASPKVLLRATTEIPVQRPGSNRLRHVSIERDHEVRRINRLIARFGYRFVFSATGDVGKLVSNHASFSPVVDPETRNAHKSSTTPDMIFGPRPAKPRWTSESA